MATRIPYTPFGKRMKIAIMEQDIPQHEFVKRLGLASSTASDAIYGRDCCERTKEWIVETLGIRVN